MSVVAEQRFCKTPTESRKYDMDFAADIATGDTLTGTPTITEVTTSDLTIAGPTFTGTKVQARISGGTAGTDYVISFQVSTTNGDTLEAYGRLDVRNSS